MNSFCSTHRIASVEKNFVVNGERSFWSVCISYLDNAGSQSSYKKDKIDYRGILNEKDFAVFAQLRTLRKDIAQKEGIPAYALFTNEQLAAMVKNRVNTLSGLEKIPGIGRSRIEKYGKNFLAILVKELKHVNNEEEKKERKKVMRRVRIDIMDIAAYDNLADAAVKAGKGKLFRPVVQKFFTQFDKNINNLRNNLLTNNAPSGIYKKFIIHDPKKRIIHAACFEDRILHHAMMNYLEPVLDRVLLPTVFACRKDMGVLKAVKWVQHCSRRFPWYVKIDINKYFDSIDHTILFNSLIKKCKGIEDILKGIIESYHTIKGKGVPIGSLTSQCFANYYLNVLDRFIMEKLHACTHVRYMDDIIWWCHDPGSAKIMLQEVIGFLKKECLLEVNTNIQINRSTKGVTFCGFRILPGKIRLTRRKKKKYIMGKEKWEKAYLNNDINAFEFQRGYDSVHSITMHADCREWRKNYLSGIYSIDV